jgi:2-polyprenyl-6-methoxyphenol hydroxylase-like FAD-dependent oxidoreductase
MTKAIVVGAGIGGLSAALALHQIGYEVKVYESVREIKPLGVGINLLPNAMRVMEALGLMDELSASGIFTRDLQYFNHLGQCFMREPRGVAAGYRIPQISIHRGEAQMILLRAVQQRIGPDAVSMGHHFADVENLPGGGVRATFTDRHNGDRRVTDTADLLVGADGIRSAVRAKFYPDEGPAKWNGLIAFRGATETAQFLSGTSMIMAGNPKSCFFMAYPMSKPHLDRGRSWTNWAVVVPAPESRKAFRTEDWNRTARLEDFLPLFEDWKFDWLDVPATIRGAPEVYEFPFIDRDPLPTWSFGGVTLLGDAAHPMHPWGSSGATLSVVDAYTLADSLSREDTIAKGFARYESIQRTITTQVINDNRKCGPVDFMEVIEERAPNGFEDIDKVIAPQELMDLVMRYKTVAAFDRDTVNKPIEIKPRRAVGV